MVYCVILNASLDIEVLLSRAGRTALRDLLTMVHFAGSMALMEGELDTLYGTEGNARGRTDAVKSGA